MPLAEVPPHVVNAILAVEDAGFWIHDGYDVRGMLRAFRANVDSGGISQGGSTITQQLVKLNLLNDEQTLDRKVQEIVLAQRLEQQMSKEEILDRYLNTVYFGNHAYGVQAAAETYFGVGVQQLDVGQAAMLAGIIRNPIQYNPVRYPERAAQRREVALDRMVDAGWLTEEEAAVWHATPTVPSFHQVLPKPNDYFPSEVEQQLLNDPRYTMLGETEADRRKAIYQGGLRVFTTLDPLAQQQALAARDSVLPLENGVVPQPGVNPETGEPNRASAALVSVEPATGAVRTMVGGPGFDSYKYNLATQNPRGVGSSMKTFVLATIMEQGYSPDDIINGIAPCNFADRYEEGGVYDVNNFADGGGDDGHDHGGNAGVVQLRVRAARAHRGLRERGRDGLPPRHPSRAARRRRRRRPRAAWCCRSSRCRSASPGSRRSRWRRPTPPSPTTASTTRRTWSTASRTATATSSTSTRRRPSSASPPRPPGWSRASSSRTCRAARAPGRRSRAAGRRQDRHEPGLHRRVVRRLHAGAVDRGVARRPGPRVRGPHLGGPRITGGQYPARIWGDFMNAWQSGRATVGFPAAPGRPGGQMLTVPGGIDLSPPPAPPEQPPPVDPNQPVPPRVPTFQGQPEGNGQGGGGGGGGDGNQGNGD